ncbi:MAG TPA: hypothetical protein VNN73_16160 [Blastocatellia bacterium]|nr:hypothetical protein [Blastocatellia bacterium]
MREKVVECGVSVAFELERFNEQLLAQAYPISNGFRMILTGKLCQNDKDQGDSQRITHTSWVTLISKAVEVIKQ